MQKRKEQTEYTDAPQTGYDVLKRSWIGQAGRVSDDILNRLGNTSTFQRFIGLSLMAQSPDTLNPKVPKDMWEYVLSNHAATDATIIENDWRDYQRRGTHIHPSIRLQDQETFITAELKLRALLQALILNRRDIGYTIKTIAEKLMRKGQLTEDESTGIRFRTDVQPANISVYIKRANGDIYSPPKNLQKEAWNWWDARDWTENLWDSRKLNSEDEVDLKRQFTGKTQPLRDQTGRLYIRTHKGVVYKPVESEQEVSRWRYDDWKNYLEEYIAKTHEDDTVSIEKEFAAGQQPFVRVFFDMDDNTPWSVIPYWGVQLQTLEKDEILAMANGNYCDPTCRTYHGSVKGLKELGELVAPVDTTIFAKELLENYIIWKASKSHEAFRVLIPAQADETTIMGIIKQIKDSGINDDELKQNFRFVLADLCPTPLLAIYAHLRERNLLSIANIVSMDVFNWNDPLEEKFDFVAADHFIDLFPDSGKYSKERVLQALTNSLLPGGKLVLTARCDTEGRTLNRDEVMEDFYTRCHSAIEKLTEELEKAETTEGAEYKGEYKSVFPTKQDLCYGIYALLAYLTLRDVYPFPDVNAINTLFKQAQPSSDQIFDHFVVPLEGKKDKVSIIISRKKSIPEQTQVFPSNEPER